MHDCQWWREELPDGQQLARLDDVDTGSWAVVGPFSDQSQEEHPLRQGGPRRLWDEVEAAYSWWQQAGQPQPWRFGLTVTPGGQHAWLDDPAQGMFAGQVSTLV